MIKLTNSKMIKNSTSKTLNKMKVKKLILKYNLIKD